MEETTRKLIVGHLELAGIDTKYVARDGATSDGYRTFLFDQDGKRVICDKSHAAITKFVPWSDAELQLIEENAELFSEWFEE